MNKALRKICFLLAVLFSFSVAACSSGKVDDTKDTDPVTSVTETTGLPFFDTMYYEEDDLPELDFNGRTVRIMSRGALNDSFSYFETNFTVEELNSSFLNDNVKPGK